MPGQCKGRVNDQIGPVWPPVHGSTGQTTRSDPVFETLISCMSWLIKSHLSIILLNKGNIANIKKGFIFDSPLLMFKNLNIANIFE